MFSTRECELNADRFGRSTVVGKNALFFNSKYEEGKTIHHGSNLQHTIILQVMVDGFTEKNFHCDALPVLTALAVQKVSGFTFFERVSSAEGQMVKGLHAGFTCDIMDKLSLELNPESAAKMFDEVAKNYGVKTMVPAHLAVVVQPTVTATAAVPAPVQQPQPQAVVPQPPTASYEDLVATASDASDLIKTTVFEFKQEEFQERLLDVVKAAFVDMLKEFNPKTPADFLDILESAGEGNAARVMEDMGGEYWNTYTIVMTDTFTGELSGFIRGAMEAFTTETVKALPEFADELKAELLPLTEAAIVEIEAKHREQVASFKEHMTRVPASTAEAVRHVAKRNKRQN